MDIYSSQRREDSARIRLHEPRAVKMQGTVRGPFCRYGRTLPSTYPVATDGSVTVVDPCYWSPRMPFYYKFDLQWDDRDGVRRSEAFVWGIRRLERFRESLRLDGRRYVIRAIEDHTLGTADLAELRGLAAALLIQDPDAALCQEASELGVLLIVHLSGERDMASELRRWGRYPAVGIGVANGQAPSGPRVASDILLAVNGSAECATVPPSADVAVYGENDLDRIARPAGCGRPVLVRRRRAGSSPAELRAACDRLQRDLAVRGQFAGYIITVD